jgi:release factor glutamine methyltransferase
VNSLPYEPAQALDGGTDGLRLLRRFFNQAPRHLSAGGLLLAETEADLGAETRSLALEAFPSAQVDLLKDLNQRDRLVRVQLA